MWCRAVQGGAKGCGGQSPSAQAAKTGALKEGSAYATGRDQIAFCWHTSASRCARTGWTVDASVQVTVVIVVAAAVRTRVAGSAIVVIVNIDLGGGQGGVKMPQAGIRGGRLMFVEGTGTGTGIVSATHILGSVWTLQHKSSAHQSKVRDRSGLSKSKSKCTLK